MIKTIAFAALLALAMFMALCAPALAASRAVAVASAEARCGAAFAGGREPTVSGAGATQDLCFPAYAVKESAATRQPAWSAAHLTAAQLPPPGTPRKDAFHVESALPRAMQATLADYGACHDRDDKGHAIAVGFFLDPALRGDSFSLANMMTQAKANNEQIFHNIEHAERDAIKTAGEVYDVTGPVIPAGAPKFCGALPQAAFIFKAVYFPATGVIGAYWMPNDASQAWQTITIAELTRRAGVDPFPALPAAQKAEVHALPAPIAGSGD